MGKITISARTGKALSIRQKLLITRANIHKKQQVAFAQKLQKLRSKRIKEGGKFQLRQALASEKAAIRSLKHQRFAIRAAKFKRITRPTIRGFKKAKRTFRKSRSIFGF